LSHLFPPSIIDNLLPHDGIVQYYGIVFSHKESTDIFQNLLQHIPWEHDRAQIYGKEIITKRKVAWYGDQSYSYTYSGVEKHALSWSDILLDLKKKTESITHQKYNSCLLNLYHNGSEGMAYHSDDEKDLDGTGSISLSFGVGRKFSFKHKTDKTKIDVFLDPGSLLEMKGDTQKYWYHRLPQTTTVHQARINLTFRKMNE
jgi:alkylated DNA repair dioxygenase AlkB